MNKKYIYLVILLLTIASFIAFGRILGNEFINFDDTGYITQNTHIQSGFNLESIQWALSSSSVQRYYWHPLTWFSHMLDWSLFKDKAWGHHLVNLLLHLGSAIFLFLFLYRTTKNIWPAAFTAAFFALHPLRVESVAWAAERKDVLSMFLGMSCLYAYAWYSETTKISRYILCLILFALALMAKPTMVTLPFVFMLADYWPLGRWPKASPLVETSSAAAQTANKKKTKRKALSLEEKKRSVPLTDSSRTILQLLWEKMPFILLTIVSSIITYWGQKISGLIASQEYASFFVRIQNAIISYASFLWKTVWPVNLAIWYPYEFTVPLWQFLFSSFILMGITVAVIYSVRKLPFLFVGWFWYLGTFIPMIGIVQLSTQARSDRFSYLPSIGIAIMLAWSITHFFPRGEIRKKLLFPAAIAVLSILAAVTWHQCGYWKNSAELFNHCLRVTKDNSQAHLYLGLAFAEKGNFREAIDQYNEGIRITPEFRIFYARGNAYSSLGKYDLAMEDYHEVIRQNPDYAEAYFNRGNAYSEMNQYQLAIEDYNETIRLKPDFADAYFNRGNVYVRGLGHYEPAVRDYNEAIRLKPDFIDAYFNKGVLLINHGDRKTGCVDLQKACALGNCKVLEAAKSKGYCF